MMDSSYHAYDWILDDRPWDSETSEETYEFTEPMALAQNNMKQWLRDIEVGPASGFSALETTQNIEEPPRGVRYRFTVAGFYRLRDWRWPKRIPVSCEVWMPGVSIHAVRFVDPEEQNPWQFMKVIYNDSVCSWRDSLSDFARDCEVAATSCAIA